MTMELILLSNNLQYLEVLDDQVIGFKAGGKYYDIEGEYYIGKGEKIRRLRSFEIDKEIGCVCVEKKHISLQNKVYQRNGKYKN